MTAPATSFRFALITALFLGMAACGEGEPEEAAVGEPALDTVPEGDTAPSGQQGAVGTDADPETGPAGPFVGLPEGWALRLDNASATAGEFKASMEEGEIRVRTGPRGVFYRDADEIAQGDYRARATLVEYNAPPDHREAYGIFIGGRDLQGSAQQYAYFLVRADGSYLVKTRSGGGTTTVVPWTRHDAVNRQVGGTQPLENTLEVQVQGNEVRFLVNDTEVDVIPVSELGLEPYGTAGLRINHNLNVGVRGWGLEVTGA